MEEALSELIEFLKNASPEVWRILIKQVYIEAASDLAWTIGLLVLGIAITLYTKKKLREEYAAEEWNFLYILSALVGLVAFVLFTSSFMWFYNPEFYAIRFIIQSITGNN